jgi:hypothetical protein
MSDIIYQLIEKYSKVKLPIQSGKKLDKIDIDLNIVHNHEKITHVSGELHPRYNVPHTEETKKLLSEIHKGRPTWMKGKSHSDDSKLKMSEAKINNPTKYWLGKERDDETKLKISKSKKGIPHKKVKCPHCNTEGGIAIMHRFHFDKCKRIK